MASQNLLYNFSKWIFDVIFSPTSSAFETYFQEPLTIENQDLQLTSLTSKINFQKYKLLKMITW